MFDPVREKIARRAALEFKNATYANLGIHKYDVEI